MLLYNNLKLLYMFLFFKCYMFKINFFLVSNYIYKNFFLKKKLKKVCIFLITKSKNNIKFIINSNKINHVVRIKKRFLKRVTYKFHKKLLRRYFVKVAKALFLKLKIIIMLNKIDKLKLVTKFKKKTLKNKLFKRRKFIKLSKKDRIILSRKRKLKRNTIRWFNFILQKKFFKKFKIMSIKCSIYNKSHAHLNEKIKKLRRK